MTVRINVENLPWTIRFLGAIMIIIGSLYLYVSQSYLIGFGLIIFGLTFATTHQRLDINNRIKEYQSYYWVLGLKFQNEKYNYPEITSLMCSQGKYNQEYGKYNRFYISGYMYKGYIMIPDHEPLFVGQNKNKATMMKKLNKIGQQLNVTVYDRTGEAD